MRHRLRITKTIVRTVFVCNYYTYQLLLIIFLFEYISHFQTVLDRK